jgi:hypothetical protein
MRLALAAAALFLITINTGWADTPAPPTYASEATAKKYCGADPVVWGNTETHVFHLAGTQYYGKTRNGMYMCQSAAVRGGYRQSAGAN